VANLDAIVKAYDIRGVVPDQLDAQAAYAFGVSFAKFTGASAVVVAQIWSMHFSVVYLRTV